MSEYQTGQDVIDGLTDKLKTAGAQLVEDKDLTPNLGDKVRDRITGFTGIVVVRSEYLQGCDRVGVQSQELHEGKPGDWQHFDITQVEVVEQGVVPVFMPETVMQDAPVRTPAQERPGGPRPDAPTRR